MNIRQFTIYPITEIDTKLLKGQGGCVGGGDTRQWDESQGAPSRIAQDLSHYSEWCEIKMDQLFTSGTFHLVFSGCAWPRGTETMGIKITTVHLLLFISNSVNICSYGEFLCKVT